MKKMIQLLKITAGSVLAAWLFWDALASVWEHEVRWWNFLLGILIMFLTVRSVPFMKGQEQLWLLFLSLAVFLPFNLKLADMIVAIYLGETLMITRLSLGMAVCLSLFSIEEILVSVLAIVLWPESLTG